jgi:hypothetical protein
VCASEAQDGQSAEKPPLLDYRSKPVVSKQRPSQPLSKAQKNIAVAMGLLVCFSIIAWDLYSNRNDASKDLESSRDVFYLAVFAIAFIAFVVSKLRPDNKVLNPPIRNRSGKEPE